MARPTTNGGTETTIAAETFRRVLGHYPTGVALITARQDDGTPLGLVVGTFSSISLNPPLVGFMPDRSSTSWPLIRETGRFCANVLSARQENVCRAFVRKEPQRFGIHCPQLTGLGNPRLEGAVLWADCVIDSVLPAGDHDLVLGRVQELDVADDAGLPLIFLRGGYGAPALPSIQMEATEYGAQLRLADLVRSEVEQVSQDLMLECQVAARVDESVVVLATAGIGQAPASTTTVGETFPLAAPFGPLFVAWDTPAAQEAWLERGRRLNGAYDTALANEELTAIHSLGYQVTTAGTPADRFERLFDPRKGYGDADVLRQATARGLDPGLTLGAQTMPAVSSMAAPATDRHGAVVMVLRLIGFDGDETPGRLLACRDRLLTAAQRASAILDAV
ncbi:Flavin reductase domain protein FMN-binding [Frankia sp. Hr75.2]|nr:Flavin reductase domain protein FMN-binding [Frankia sp. Hr75.2]